MKRLPLFFAVAFALPLSAQETNENAGLRVFLDCQRFFCDLDYYREQIAFIDYVRDRQDADLHVLVNTQETGGGIEFTVNFIGLRDYSGKQDTLTFGSSATDTQNERRQALANALKMGLMPYVFGTQAADNISISYAAAPPTGPQVRPAQTDDDPWNYWVYTVRANGNLNLSENLKDYSIGGGFTAIRTTEDWKIRLLANGNYNENRFTLSDSVLVTTRKSGRGEALVARSAGEHWSFGGRVRATTSTFRNEDLVLRFAPAVEFNVFPYSESASKKLTVLYDIGFSSFSYGAVTVFNETDEILPDHSLAVSLNMVQPWGSSNFSFNATNYLNDFSQHRIGVDGFMNIRLFRGLNFNMFASVARIKNQRNLARGGASDAEILVRLRQLQTDYQAFVNFGFTYRFGSIFNNITNPRFDEGGFFFREF